MDTVQRRKQRRLRSWRHEQQSIAVALDTLQHHSAQRQKTARAREEVRGEVHGHVLGEPPLQAAGTQYFAMGVDEVLVAGGSRSDRLAPVSGPQERVQRHIEKQLVDSAPGLPVLDAAVPLMWGDGEVGSVLSPWEPLPPPARVQSCRELAAGQLEQVRRRTATDVCNWVTPSRRSLTQDESRSMVMLIPDYTGGATASPGRFSNTGRRAEVSTDPGADRGRGGAGG